MSSPDKRDAGVEAGLGIATSTEIDGAEYGIPFRDFVQTLWRRFWMVLTVMVVVVGVAVGYGFVQIPMYEASARILIGQKQEVGDPYNLAGDVEGIQQLTQTLAAAVNSRPVAQAVIQKLDLPISPEYLMAHLEAQQVPDTQFVQVTYKDSSPERAQRVTNAIGDVFSAQISEISPKASGVTAIVWEPATVPTDPVSPNFLFIIPLALMLGTALGVTLALLHIYWENRWRSPEEVESAFGKRVVAVIPAFKTSKGQKGR